MSLEEKYVFELLDLSLHDRAAFSCGEAELDAYLHRYAKQDAKRSLSRIHVMTSASNPSKILGYYTLSNYAVNVTELPEELRKGLPTRRPIGTTLLGRLAIDATSQGQGLGELLLFDALYKALLVNQQTMASVAVIIDALHERAKNFYLRYDAVPFIEQPLKLFLPMSKIEEIFKEVGLVGG